MPLDEKLQQKILRPDTGTKHGGSPPRSQLNYASNAIYVPSVVYIFSIILAYAFSTFALLSFFVGVSSPPSSEKLVGKIMNLPILKALFTQTFSFSFVSLMAC